MHSWMRRTDEKRWRRAPLVSMMLGALVAIGCGSADEGETSVLESVQALNTPNGIALNGIALNGIVLNGIALNGIALNGIALNGVTLDETTFVGDASGQIIEGDAFVGATFTGALSNGQPLSLRIDDRVELAEPGVFAYAVSYLSSASTGTWKSLCGETASGDPIRAIPLAGTWDYSQRQGTSGMHLASPTEFTFACRGQAIAKCVELGYLPWGEVTECLASNTCKTISGADFHQACTRMLRADYCGDGVPHTQNGTPIDVWDQFGIQEAAVTTFTLEAEWTPMGARCIEHTRWLGDAGGSVAAYVNANCSSHWADAQPTYDCGGPGSTLHTANGFFVPILVRSLLVNESADPSDGD